MQHTTTFNPSQIHLLRMFAIDSSNEALDEMKEVLFHHYSQKMERMLNEMWESGEISNERLKEINNMDLHQLK